MTVANAPSQEDPPARPDLAGLHLSGFGMERDSVSVALEAAASRLGRAADYEPLYVRSGNAFAPAIATGESCRSWWHVQARAGTGNLPALAASLGLTAKPLVLPPRPAQDDPALAAWFRTAAAAAGAAMDSGAVLLSDGGWDEPGGWNWAGIVTEVGADGAIRGAALSAATGDGKEGVAWRYPGTLWAIRPGPTPTLPAEVDRATLRLAVERIRGTGVYAAREDLLFGLPAVDRWIAAMKSDRGFCADCFSRNPVPGVHDAPDNDRRLRAAALVVARNLRSGFSAIPPAARLALDQAANCYQRIAQYLSEPLDAKGFYDSLNSLEAQGLYAQRQLWRVRCELAAAADRFEEALRTVEGRPRNLRLASDGRTRMMTLEGLASVTHADDPNWFGAGLSFAVKQIGVEADYHTLMGDLGTAFIMQASDRSPVNQGALDAGWWPLDPVGLRIFMAFAGRVHGFQAEFASSGSGAVDATAYRERFVSRIAAELRARRPCLGFIPCLNVITGLNPETGALLRVCPGTTTMPDSWETDPDARPWELVFLAPRTSPAIPRPEADRQALRHALALMRDEIALPWGYCSGAKAFAIWAAALRDREHLGQHYWHYNVVRCLLQSRRAAVVYLEAMASRWPEGAARHLRAAVGHYQAVIAACAEADTSEIALTRPGEGRETLARLAERIAGLEVQAATALEQALAEMGYTPDPDPVRLVLAGVPPVSFPGGAKNDGAPQMTCFPSCLGAVLRFLKEDFGSVEIDQRPLPPIHPMSPGESSTTLDKSYVLLMGATGAAFRLNWAPDWEPGSDLRWLSDDPWAPFRQGFAAAGRSFEVVEKHGMPDDERLFRQRVIASIRQGLPVIARGIIGPPEGCLVSGYDESGAVLTGWSFWQGDAKADPEVGFEPDGSFRKRAWFKDTESLLLIGERGPRPQPREQHRAALGWALQVMRTPLTHKTRANGIAAFDAWAEALRRDGEFDGQDLAGLKRRMVAHLVATDVIAEGRWYAHNYLKTAALDLPEVKDRLRQAAELCRDEHDLVWEMWRVGGSWQQLGEEAALRSFSAAATRRQLADMVLKLRDADREVAAAIEEALGKLVAMLDGPPGILRPDYGKLALAGDHTITLDGHPYRLEWVSGARLGELHLSGADAVQPRATDYYPDHADPLYNLHCDVVATGKDEPSDEALQQQGKNWSDHWRELALATEDRPFALAAFSEGRLAGHLRFFSAERSRLRVVPEDQQKAWQQPGTLFITAGCVDQAGADDRLDAELLRQVIAWARVQGYTSVVALGWSNLRTYAIWGESLPTDVYAGAGFSVAARLDADAPALADMRAGAHGPAVQQRIEDEIAASSRPQPEFFVVMRLNLKADVMSPPTVKREGDQVAIAGLEQESWGGKTSRQNSMLACLALAAQRLGEDVSYEEVMGLSAAAFRFQVHKDGMCPSSPHACCGFSCWGLAQQALGITAEHIPTGDQQEANRARARQAVMASIEGGIPAFSSSEECSLLVGYDKNGETLLGRWYSSGDPGYAPMKDWPWAVEILRKEAAPDRRQAILRALRSAVDLARTEENQDGTYPSGFRALRLWVGWLRDQERMARETTGDKLFGTALGNAFILDCWVDARRAAAIFLRANAQRLGAEAEVPLLRAAQLYDGLQDKVCKARALAPWPWQITPEKPWTPAMMQQQADLVEALIPVEQAAIAEIEQALGVTDAHGNP